MEGVDDEFISVRESLMCGVPLVREEVKGFEHDWDTTMTRLDIF